MAHRLLIILLALALAPAATAQTHRPLVVMNVAAHPDDEDGATLTYYRHAQDAIAYSVIFTRGEGGQNEIGPELYEELGAIRTVETERAARLLGTQVFFLNYVDFGFSKHADETFAEWGGRDAVTARLVRLIRELKPDVLFTNHDTVTVGASRQHGHHQAVGIAAYDAFVLAADPSYHPEQLEEPGVDLWQPKRLFLRQWSADDRTDVRLPVGTIDPERGISYAAIAARALHEHASQGMEQFAARLAAIEVNPFVHYRTAVDTPIAPDDLAAALEPNRAARPSLSYLIDSGRVHGLPAGSVTLSDSLAVPGSTIRLTFDPAALPEQRVQWRFHGAIDTVLYLTGDTPSTARLRLAGDAVPTHPRASFQYERYRSTPPVWYGIYRAGTDDLLAAGYLPLEVVPPLYLDALPDVVRLQPGTMTLPVDVRAYHPEATAVRVQIALSSDDRNEVLLQRHVELEPMALDDPAQLTLDLPAGLPPGRYTLSLTGVADGEVTTEPVHDFVRARVFDVRVPPALRVGVVQSYDNTLDQALDELGVEHVLLDSAALAVGRFDDLHTIIVDIRAYLVRPDLRAHNDRLLAWVRQGGHLVVNYHKTFEWNPAASEAQGSGGYAPYPLTLGRERVTREDAPVTVLAPEHPLFHEPNEIGDAAWEGWVQERGLYFPATYDERYQELFSLSDPGEEPLRGSTLLAHVGEGTYLYTALVWYRQLKAYHPGAYHFLANMLSLPLVDGRTAATH